MRSSSGSTTCTKFMLFRYCCSIGTKYNRNIQMLLSKIANRPSINSLPVRGALLLGSVMTFTLLGDAFLYPLLPVFGKSLGFSVFEIGLLLSVNRFVRILGNTYIANVIRQFGIKRIITLSAILASITTYLYGLQIGFYLFLMTRILWGLCYSGLQVSSLSYIARLPSHSGFALGIVESLKALGPLLILIIGPVLVTEIGIYSGLQLIALISTVGILFSIALPHSNTPPFQRVKTKDSFAFTPINLLVFLLSLTINGILVVALSELLSNTLSPAQNLLAIVAFYILLKKLFAFGLSMLSSFITLYIKVQHLYVFSVFMCLAGLLFIASGLTTIGIVWTFLFNAVVVTYSPLLAIRKSADNNSSLKAISGVNTWSDLGAALGALSGIQVIVSLGSSALFYTLSAILFILLIYFVKEYGNTDSRTL